MLHADFTVHEERYRDRRGQIAAYFDRTAADAWARLTSDAPVSGIRATVRAGRDAMRNTLLSWLPEDLSGQRILDAGCGTGALAVELAQRGAQVVAIDLSPTLVDLAARRTPAHLRSRIAFSAGDMLDPALGDFDHAVCMDSLIHYDLPHVVAALGALAVRARGSLLFTFAPATPLLVPMMAIGRLFPKGNRSPSIVPVSERKVHEALHDDAVLGTWRPHRSLRISRGFYKSHALGLRPGGARA